MSVGTPAWGTHFIGKVRERRARMIHPMSQTRDMGHPIILGDGQESGAS